MKKIIFGFLIVSLVLLVSGCTSNIPVCGDGECTIDEESMNNCPEDCKLIEPLTSTEFSLHQGKTLTIQLQEEHVVSYLDLDLGEKRCYSDSELSIISLDDKWSKELSIGQSQEIVDNVNLIIVDASDNIYPEPDTVTFCLSSTLECDQTIKMTEGENKTITYNNTDYEVEISFVTCRLEEIEPAKVKLEVNNIESKFLAAKESFDFGKVNVKIIDIFPQEDIVKSYVRLNISE